MVPFATVGQADAYHADHMFASSWENDMEPEDKRRALITASRLLLDHVPWLANYVDNLTVPIPEALVNATAEFARRLFERGDPFTASDTEGMKRMKAGPVEMEFTEGSEGFTTVIPQEVRAMLNPIAPWQASSLNVPLVRY